MSFFKDKVILVTGAGGSIGSELCRQIMREHPKQLVLFDSSELALYNIDRELGGKAVPVLGDVSDVSDVTCAFANYDIDIVYHAAAYKHVTLCQKNWAPAHRVNIYGTKLVVNNALAYGVPRLILISTDKAVRPTCVMGETKRLAEEIVREANYTTVRLGNVYGSSGSVVPLWREQIAAGKPVTITHPDATRYFLHPFEAAHRIMEATELAVGGETFVPCMGGRQFIEDVARELGAKKFNVIGLRPGEKLHEELYVGKQVMTPYPRIFKDAA